MLFPTTALYNHFHYGNITNSAYIKKLSILSATKYKIGWT